MNNLGESVYRVLLLCKECPSNGIIVIEPSFIKHSSTFVAKEGGVSVLPKIESFLLFLAEKSQEVKETLVWCGIYSKYPHLSSEVEIQRACIYWQEWIQNEKWNFPMLHWFTSTWIFIVIGRLWIDSSSNLRASLVLVQLCGYQVQLKVITSKFRNTF